MYIFQVASKVGSALFGLATRGLRGGGGGGGEAAAEGSGGDGEKAAAAKSQPTYAWRALQVRTHSILAPDCGFDTRKRRVRAPLPYLLTYLRPWRARLQDGAREARQLALAPRGALAAVADSLGRVMLLDYAAPFAAVRMWKGYRDATVAWLDSPSGELSLTGSCPCRYLHVSGGNNLTG